MKLSILVVACFVAACAGPAGGASNSESLPEGPSVKKAPLPYTAAQIRDAHPSGTVVKYGISRKGAADVVQIMTFDASDADGTTVTTSTHRPDGTRIGNAASHRSTWAQLRDHASFAAKDTVIGASRCEVPAGTFDCAKYDVTLPDGTVQRFHFAKKKPGPPVLLVMQKDGEETFRMELTEFTPGA